MQQFKLPRHFGDYFLLRYATKITTATNNRSNSYVFVGAHNSEYCIYHSSWSVKSNSVLYIEDLSSNRLIANQSTFS
jgi:hypothetical protein